MEKDLTLEDENEDTVLRSEGQITYNTQKVRKIKSHTINDTSSFLPSMEPFIQTLNQLNFKVALFVIAVTCILIFLFFNFLSPKDLGGNHPLVDESEIKCSNKYMDNILQQMMFRPQWCYQNNPKIESPYYRRPTSLSYFAYRLRTEPENRMYLEAEEYYYQCKYGINNYQEEHSFCVISPGRNLASFNSSSYGSGDRISYMNFFASINRQLYSNYKLVVIDDASIDNSAEIIQEYLKKEYPVLSQKTKIISNKDRLYVLKNKDIMIREYCNSGDIILDIDADDELIGRQVFKLVNALYQKGMKGTGPIATSSNDEIWLLYLNNISFDFDLKEPLIGLSNKIPNNKILNKKSRRSEFAVMHLRTFRRELYMSIPVEYFEEKGDPSNFHLYASDAFIYGALVELSGVNHLVFVDEMVYYYERANRFKDLERKKQCALESRVETPFKELDNLKSVGVQDNLFVVSKEEVEEETHKMDNLFEKMGGKKFTFQNYNLNQIKSYYQQHPHLQQNQEVTIEFMQSSLSTIELQSNEFTVQQNQKVSFAWRLKENAYNSEFILAESYLFAKKYAVEKEGKIDDEFGKESPICINVYDNNIQRPREFEFNLHNLLASISRQKYTNFKINIFIDEQNQTIKINTIKHYLRAEHPWMMHHIYFIEKQDHSFHRNNEAFYINFMINEHCKEDDVIMILEPYGQIIGSNIFPLINNILENHPTKSLIFAHSFSVSKNSKSSNQFKVELGPLELVNATKINSHYFGNKWYQFFPYCFKKKAYKELYEPLFCSDSKSCHAINLHWQVFQTLVSLLKPDSIEYLPEIVYETVLEQEIIVNLLEQEKIISETIQKVISP